ncbi:MAG: hypothetical protein IJW56_01575 [Bacteroides sp.]|nr:hypothetical protein [Bacteroides sp.]
MKKFLYYILSGYLILSVFSCQQHRSNSDWIRLADEQVGKNTDSLKVLLSQVKRPLELQGEDRLLYGWLSGYVHAKKGTSMVEDSLLIPLADSYIANKDTTRKLLSYWMKARYVSWLERHDEAFAVYEEGLQKATELKDTFWMQEMLMEQGRMYRFVWQDYPKCTDIFRRMVAIKEKPVEVYSLGLAMALEKNDSAVYWMNRAAELSMQKKDTAQAIFFLRNMMETQVHALNTHRDAIQTAQRLIRENERLHLNDNFLVLACYESIIESYLKLGDLDAAQHSLNLADSMAQIVDPKNPVTKNMLSLYQALIDYTRNRHFDLNDMLQYNVLLYEKILDERKNIRQFKNSNEQLTADALEMIVEQQRTQISLMFVLLVAFVLAMSIVIVVNLYRRKLRKSKEQINSFILTQQKNEGIIRHNEQMIADLQTQMADGQEAQEQLEESKAALLALQRHTEALRNENVGLQQRIEKYKHQPSEEEIEKLRANANRMHQLEERERVLTAELANNNELMRKLREKPKFLGEAEWKKLADITNRVYNRFTERIKSQYPHLTEVDIQLCILLKLRFTVSQIAILTATSPSSVSVQKNRLKKRLLQVDEHLFDNGQTLDMYWWMY